MMEESHENNTASSTEEPANAITASSTDEYRNINLSGVELKRKDAPVYSRFVVLLEPIMLVYALYVGAISPLSDQYVRAKISNDYNLTDGNLNKSESSLDRCNNGSSHYENDDIDSQASLWILYSNVASLVPGLFSQILLGSYSDRGGRKVAIIIPQIGAIVRCVCFLAVIYFDWPLYVIVIGAFIEGLSGGISMSFAAAYSYVADVTSDNRSLRMTILESCFGLGTVVSQVIVGYLITGLGYFYPFLILTVTILLDLVITACLLPETITRDQEVRFWSLRHFRKAFHLYSRDNGTGRRWKLLLSLAIAFFTCSVTLGRTDVLIIYLLDAPFCWSSVLIGYFGAVFMLICAPTSVLMIKLTQPTLSDSHLLLIGTISAVAYQAVVVFSTTTILIFMATVAGAASYLVTPMVRTISSKLVKQEEEGAMFATIGLAITLSVLVGQLVFNNLYSATVFVWAPLTFVIMLGTLGFTTLLTVVFVIKEKVEKRCYANCDERTPLIS